MSNTRPVPNLTAPFAEVKGNRAWLISPWMQFFQQFVQRAPTIEDVTSGGSPFQANQNGTVIVTGAATVSLIRGQVTINLTGERIIPISIGDSIAWTGGATVQFLGA
jgi:hypothetical protein